MSEDTVLGIGADANGPGLGWRICMVALDGLSYGHISFGVWAGRAERTSRQRMGNGWATDGHTEKGLGLALDGLYISDGCCFGG